MRLRLRGTGGDGAPKGRSTWRSRRRRFRAEAAAAPQWGATKLDASAPVAGAVAVSSLDGLRLSNRRALPARRALTWAFVGGGGPVLGPAATALGLEAWLTL